MATAQNTATLTVRVLDPAGAAIPGAQVTLSQALANLTKQTQAGPDGVARLTNIPLQSYQLEVVRQGFGAVRRTVELRSSVGQYLDIEIGRAHV